MVNKTNHHKTNKSTRATNARPAAATTTTPSLPLFSQSFAPTQKPFSKSARRSPSYWARMHQSQSQATTAITANANKHAALRRLLAALDPEFFAREFLNFHPGPAQKRILQQAVTNKRIALNCNRQWGKSTLAAILAVHRLVILPGSTVLIVGPSGRQSGETLRKVAGFLNFLKIPTRGDGVNKASLLLPNGSRIVALPAVDATSRGFSAVSMLVVDEASRVRDCVYLALRPALAVSRGDIILVSTPNGRRGFFYREMSAMTVAAPGIKEDWLRHTGPVSESLPRVPPDFIAEERARGETYFRQEYLCEFVETGKYVFDEQLLHKIVKHELEAFTWL